MTRSRLPAAAALAAIVAGGLVLRLVSARQSLFGDELLTYAVAHQGSPGDVLHALNHSIESTPPLPYLLAWAGGKLSSAPDDIRAPSLLAGVLLIPSVYALGRRIAGAAAGLLAAVLIALDPFAIFFSVEARAYAPAALLLVLATLAVLRARERPTVLRWALFALAVAAGLYTHYALVFPLAVLILWAAWTLPPARRPLALCCLAVALAYVPWLPHLHGRELEGVAAFYPLTGTHVGDALLRNLDGLPFSPLRVVPGVVALVLLAEGALLALAGPRLLRRPRPAGAVRRDGVVLLLLLALATPLGLLLYHLFGGPDLYNPRHLFPATPFLFVLGAALVVSAPRTLALAAGGAVVVALAIGAATSFRDDAQRPQYARAAEVVNRERRPADIVVSVPVIPPGPDLLLYLHGRPRYVLALPALGPRGPVAGIDPRVWRTARRVWVGSPDAALTEPPAGAGWRVAERRHWPGTVGYGLTLWERG